MPSVGTAKLRILLILVLSLTLLHIAATFLNVDVNTKTAPAGHVNSLVSGLFGFVDWVTFANVVPMGSPPWVILNLYQLAALLTLLYLIYAFAREILSV